MEAVIENRFVIYFHSNTGTKGVTSIMCIKQ